MWTIWVALTTGLTYTLLNPALIGYVDLLGCPNYWANFYIAPSRESETLVLPGHVLLPMLLYFSSGTWRKLID